MQFSHRLKPKHFSSMLTFPWWFLEKFRKAWLMNLGINCSWFRLQYYILIENKSCTIFVKTSLLMKERQQPPAADSELGQWSLEENLGASITHTGKQFRVTWSDRDAANSKTRWIRAQEPSSAAAAANRADSRLFSLWSWYLHTAQYHTMTSGCDNHYSEPWNTGNVFQGPEKKSAIHILKNNTNFIEIKYIYTFCANFICFFSKGTREMQSSTSKCA